MHLVFLIPVLSFLSLIPVLCSSLPSLLHCFSHSVIPFAPLPILIFSFSAPLFSAPLLLSFCHSLCSSTHSHFSFRLCSSLPSLFHCFSHSVIPFAPLLILIFLSLLLSPFSAALLLSFSHSLCSFLSLLRYCPTRSFISCYINLKLQFSRQDSEHLSQVSPLMMLR